MPTSPLESAGAAIQPISAAPLHVNEFFTGMWTNGNPLGPGPVPYIYQKSYAMSRFERLLDGADVEISPRLTLIRRPGHTVYNPGPFPPINRFYEFRGFTTTDEVIHLIADCDAPTNKLTNPNFDSGSTGWDFGFDPVLFGSWALGVAGRPNDDGTFGVGNLAIFGGLGTAAVTNQQHIAAAAGVKVSASCWALGEIGATGTAALEIKFYNASNALLATVASPAAPPTYYWTREEITATAPASSSYAKVDFAVTGSTTTTPGPRWFASLFTAGYAPAGPTVREVTQPNSNMVLWTKDPAAGRTSFVSNGNVLYAGDGLATHKYVTSAQSWTPNTLNQPGSSIIDTNGNIQMAMGAQTATITNVQVESVTLSGGATGRKVTIFLDPSTPLDIQNNIALTLAGMTTVPSLNGTTTYTAVVMSSTQVYFTGAFTGVPVTAFSNETGTASTGSGASGSSAPAWNTTKGLVTQDGGNQWVNMGSASQNWGIAAPTVAPTVTQADAPSVFPYWAANTWYAPAGGFVIIDTNSNLQQLTTAGITKTGSPPAWGTTPGSTTPDGTCIWTFKGSGVWAASHAYAVGDLLVATFTYYITTTEYQPSVRQWVPITVSNTVTALFKCTTAGTSGANTPAWSNGLGALTLDGTVTWTNAGNAPVWPGGSGVTAQTLSLFSTVIDSATLGHLQTAQKLGESGATAPTWQTAQGAVTADNTMSWLNSGPYSVANTDAWIWAYSGKNSITGEISTASPLSQPLIVSAGKLAIVQGPGLADPQIDTIVLWRTTQGGSTLMFDDEFPNPGAGQTWIYTETNQDPSTTNLDANGNPVAGGTPQPGQLNFLITAPISSSNNPPPAAFVPKAYYLGRIWGYVNNLLRWSGGPDIVTGNGDSAFPPVNQFRFTSKGVLCWPTSIGLLCFTTTDIWAVLGQGTSSSPFYTVNFQEGIGMASQDAFAVNGSTAYAMLTSHQIVSMDPGAGELEVGFPIADIFDTYFDPRAAYITWHQGRSADTALYVADGTDFWYRMAAVSAPESGNVWSPAAVIHSAGGVRAMTSAEIAPGEKVLILGPNVDGNPILRRDFSVNSDAGIPYPAHASIAPVVLSQPGSTAGVQFVVTEEKRIDGASPLVVKMLFDEIHDFIHVHDADWRVLRNRSNDPPNLPRQKSILAQRLWAQQDPSTVVRCRFYQQDISWLAEDFANEVYTNTVYGRLPEKARR